MSVGDEGTDSYDPSTQRYAASLERNSDTCHNTGRPQGHEAVTAGQMLCGSTPHAHRSGQTLQGREEMVVVPGLGGGRGGAARV